MRCEYCESMRRLAIVIGVQLEFRTVTTASIGMPAGSNNVPTVNALTFIFILFSLFISQTATAVIG